MDILKNHPLLKKRLDNKENICVSFCTPAYGGLVNIRYMTSVMNTIFMLSCIGIKSMFFFTDYESLVQRGRNTLTAKALGDDDVTHVFFIDADIDFQPESLLNLLEHDVDIVGGIYPKKSWLFDKVQNLGQFIELYKQDHNKGIDPTKFLKHCLLDYNFNGVVSSIQNNLSQVDNIATGFMLIKRKVFLTMMEKIPNIKYRDDIGGTNEKESKYLHSFFDCGIVDGRYLSEDFYFCKRWRDLGGKIYCDVSIPLNHIGNCMFEGRLSSVLSLSKITPMDIPNPQIMASLNPPDPVPI